MNTKHQIITAVTVAAVAASLAGCGSADEMASAVPQGGCAIALDDEGTNDRFVILHDSTLSRDEGASFGETVAETVLSSIAADGPIVSIGTYGGSDAEVSFSECFGGHFRPDFNSNARRLDAIPDFVEGAMQAFNSLPGGWPSSDPTAGYRAGAEKLRDGEGARTLVIITDGIATAGCAALGETTDPNDISLIDELVSGCIDRGALPDLSGASVYLVGVGRSSPPLTSESVQFLQQLSHALCNATGAECEITLDTPTGL